ncbi:hypothetical protein R1flu_005183 [Riccia fluitans]|uniref:Protein DETOXIFICATION n=1 Tax=Riccia fluitans TaxID=41844 RepID=A0ABD1YTD9_9MARC
METSRSENETLLPQTQPTDDGTHDNGPSRIPASVEVKKQLKLAGPLALNNFSVYCLSILTSMFIGHLGTLELSSSSLAMSIASVSGYTLMLGLASGLETFCGQAFGAEKYALLGVFLQSEFLASLSLCFPVVALWWNIEPVLVYLGQDEEVSKMAGLFLRFMSPSIFASAVQQALVIYLQMQNVVIPQLVSSVSTCILHVLTCFILIRKLEFGFAGGAISLCLSYFYNVIFLLVWISFNSTTYRKTWVGISSEAVAALPTFFRVAIPSVFMKCMEYWAYELMVPFTGLLPNPVFECSILYIVLGTSAIIYMVSMAIGAGVSTRVSNETGAGRPFSARHAFKIGLLLVLVYTGSMAVIVIIFRKSWPFVFSDDRVVVDAVAKWLPFVALTFLLEGVQAVCSGVARGCGWQRTGAWINLISFYVIGAPLVYVFSVRLQMGAQGVWLGYYTGLLLQMSIYSTVAFRTNWPKMAERVQKLHFPTTLVLS